MFEGSGADQVADPAGTVLFQGTGQFVQGGASGHYVIQYQDVFTVQGLATFKSAPHVLLPQFPGQAGLGLGFPYPFTDIQGERKPETASEGPGDFHGLIKAPFPQVARRKGHGQQQVRQVVGKQNGCLGH